MQGCQSPWNRRGSKGAMPPPHILTDNLILYLNKGRQIMPNILLTALLPDFQTSLPTALNMILSLRGLTDLSLQNILPKYYHQTILLCCR